MSQIGDGKPPIGIRTPVKISLSTLYKQKYESEISSGLHGFELKKYKPGTILEIENEDNKTQLFLILKPTDLYHIICHINSGEIYSYTDVWFQNMRSITVKKEPK